MKKIVFLSYINRSGSTFLINQLSKSQQICICPEAEILFDLFLKYPLKISLTSNNHLNWIIDILNRDKKFSAWNLSLEKLKNIFINGKSNIELFFNLLNTYVDINNPLAEIIIYKHTWSIKLIPELIDILKNESEFKWILLLRDIRAIYTSQKNTISPITHKPMCSNWFGLVREWNYFMLQTNKYKDNDLIKVIRYEDLINNTKKEITLLCDFLNVNFDLCWINQKNGLVYNMLSLEYQNIHQNINLLPNPDLINQWRKVLPLKIIYLLTAFSRKGLSNKQSESLAQLNIHIFSYLPTIIIEIVLYALICTKKWAIKILKASFLLKLLY